MWVNSAVPFVAFGFTDQTVLIYAGETIDSTLGVRFALPTLAAAAFGQVFSDTCGVLLGSSIEAAATKLGLPLPGLSEEQQNLAVVKKVATFGRVCGVIMGCLLGMTNLLVVDWEATERAKRAEELKSIMKTVMEDGRDVLGCSRATLWIVDEDKKELWSSVAQGENSIMRIPLDTHSIAGWVAVNRTTANIASVKDDPRWIGKKSGKDYVPTSMICAPVLSGDGKRTIAVIQVLDKNGPDGKIVPFDDNDEKVLKLLAGHTRLFMEPDADD